LLIEDKHRQPFPRLFPQAWPPPRRSEKFEFTEY
jgi:hypothetical protein